MSVLLTTTTSLSLAACGASKQSGPTRGPTEGASSDSGDETGGVGVPTVDTGTASGETGTADTPMTATGDTGSETGDTASTGHGLDCPEWEAAVPVGILAPSITELSGLGASRTAPGLWWAHEDSGAAAELHVIDELGSRLATWSLADVSPVDWEDMAVGGEPSTIYVGDIGDNGRRRETVSVHVFAEPLDPLVGGVIEPETWTWTYPDGAHDAETLLLDPTTGDVLVVTKSFFGDTLVYRGPAGDGALVEVVSMDFGVPPLGGIATTGGDWSAETGLLIRTYANEAWLWPMSVGDDLATRLGAPPCRVPIGIEFQGEAIAFSTDGTRLLHAAEGSGVVVFSVDRR